MGALPSTISCNPVNLDPIIGGVYSISGRNFAPQCQFDTTGPVLSVTNVPLYECVTSCGANKACTAVSWLDNICYAKAATGDLVPSVRVSSFVAADTGNSPTCPTWEGKTYTANNQQFTISCNADYPGIGDMGSSSQPTFGDCVDSCSSTSGCIAAVYSGNAW